MMSNWGTSVGAFIGGLAGGLIGGPAGAVAGAGLGAWIGGQQEAAAEPPVLPMNIQWEDDEDGRLITIVPQFPYQEGLIYRLDLITPDGSRLLPALTPFMRDDDGVFYSWSPSMLLDDGTHGGQAYIPFGAFVFRGPQPFLRITTLNEHSCLGVSTFTLIWPTDPPYSWIAFLRPIVGLGMVVAHADGQRLSRATVKMMRKHMTEGLALDERGTFALKKLMKEPSFYSPSDYAGMHLMRLPVEYRHSTLEFLAEVARVQGGMYVSPNAIELIWNTAMQWGMPPSEWEIFAQNEGFTSHRDRSYRQQQEYNQYQEQEYNQSSHQHTQAPPPEPPPLDPYEVLGISRGASRAEIKTAYREKIKAYHPDVVANLAPEFQALAHEKTRQLNEAYQALTR